MAHDAQRQFCREVKQRFPQFFEQARVLEVGARNVNGCVREEFTNCDYVGVDAQDGKDVDVVCLGHEYSGDPDSFDVVCSTETLEHDPHAPQTIAAMLQLLRKGGLMVITCAATERAEHGTGKTGKKYGPDPDFYRAVTMELLWRWLQGPPGIFTEIYLRHDRAIGDLYFFGIKG